MVRVSANSAVVKGGLQNSRNQDSGNCISDFFGVLLKKELLAHVFKRIDYQNTVKTNRNVRYQLTFLYY